MSRPMDLPVVDEERLAAMEAALMLLDLPLPLVEEVPPDGVRIVCKTGMCAPVWNGGHGYLVDVGPVARATDAYLSHALRRHVAL